MPAPITPTAKQTSAPLRFAKATRRTTTARRRICALWDFTATTQHLFALVCILRMKTAHPVRSVVNIGMGENACLASASFRFKLRKDRLVHQYTLVLPTAVEAASIVTLRATRASNTSALSAPILAMILNARLSLRHPASAPFPRGAECAATHMLGTFLLRPSSFTATSCNASADIRASLPQPANASWIIAQITSIVICSKYSRGWEWIMT